MLRVRVFEAAGAEIAEAGSRIAVGVLQLGWPDALIHLSRRRADRFPLMSEPRPELVSVWKRSESRRDVAIRIHPIKSGVIEDDIQDDADVFAVGCSDKIDQLFPCAEVRIDIEEVLNAVSMKGVEVSTLLEDRTQPDGRDAELFEIVELRLDALECAALPAERP